jgi:hypothetical protein
MSICRLRYALEGSECNPLIFFLNMEAHILFYIFLGGTGVLTQGLMLVTQALYLLCLEYF